MPGEHETVQSTDPRAADLAAAGWRVVAESWGARMRLADPPDLGAARAAVRAATPLGYDVRELGPEWAAAVMDLERATHDDYPAGPATSVPERTEDDVRALWTSGARVFGAVRGGELVAVTVARPGDDRAETDFTSVRRDHRRQGLAVAVKAASIIALAEDGARVFGTGGAQVNAGSIRMNERLGYRIEERWLSFGPPE
ncbi:GNAT family N-acetyltransferase [Curtobacterium sp. Leaf261]|uniref:GNAT family N-acetyltransferase n=1 Tax=Curtobacterium sp. Leaf261 TaxID=1736311 RepID=UPI0006F56C1E|nr:GNAT family N-acetyltransferase [Curtobacterium sp. Leaf261]KQO62751.1 hypothetical protein ASF23_07285 [Curtobacterium sp. Leaf261]